MAFPAQAVRFGNVVHLKPATYLHKCVSGNFDTVDFFLLEAEEDQKKYRSIAMAEAPDTVALIHVLEDNRVFLGHSKNFLDIEKTATKPTCKQYALLNQMIAETEFQGDYYGKGQTQIERAAGYKLALQKKLLTSIVESMADDAAKGKGNLFQTIQKLLNAVNRL